MEIKATLEMHENEGIVKWTCLVRGASGRIRDVIEDMEPIPPGCPAMAISNAMMSAAMVVRAITLQDYYREHPEHLYDFPSDYEFAKLNIAKYKSEFLAKIIAKENRGDK